MGGKHAPAPPGVAPRVLWGDPETLNQRLAGNFKDIRTELIPIDFDMPMSPSGTVDLIRIYFEPTKMAFSRLDEERASGAAGRSAGIVVVCKCRRGQTARTLVHNEYLQVLAIRI